MHGHEITRTRALIFYYWHLLVTHVNHSKGHKRVLVGERENRDWIWPRGPLPACPRIPLANRDAGRIRPGLGHNIDYTTGATAALTFYFGILILRLKECQGALKREDTQFLPGMDFSPLALAVLSAPPSRELFRSACMSR